MPAAAAAGAADGLDASRAGGGTRTDRDEQLACLVFRCADRARERPDAARLERLVLQHVAQETLSLLIPAHGGEPLADPEQRSKQLRDRADHGTATLGRIARSVKQTLEAPPVGLVCQPELLSEHEEQALLEELKRLDFHEIRMHGVVAKRTARHFGVDYDYEARAAVHEAGPIPDWLVPVRERAAELAGVAPDELAEILVQRYPPGAQIGWHRDAPAFGIVVGISLGSTARMRFRRDKGGVRRTFELELEPRSGYVLAGEARNAWQHHVPPAKALRYSITFRTLRK